MKHTPAPWMTKKFTISGHTNVVANTLIAKVYSTAYKDIENETANAKLIAAAPELFEALQYYFDVLEEVRGKDWDEKPDHVLSKMINAVKKAKGLNA